MTKNPLLLFIGIALGPFMIGIDFLIMSVAIEPMAKALAADIQTVQWFLTGYAIGNSSFLVTAGRLADRFGRKQMYLAGVILFILSSTSIAISHHALPIIIARLLQGVSGGVMTTTAIAIIAALYEPQLRTKWIAGLVGLTGLGMVIGPVLGGLLIHYAGWRWIFILNLPIGLIGMLFTIFFVPRQTTATSKPKLDLIGIILFIATLTFFTIGIERINVINLLLSGVLLLVFLYTETKVSNPLIIFKLFTVQNFLAANVVGFALYFTITAWILIYGIYLQQVLNFSELKSGISLLPFGIVLAIVSLRMSKLTQRFGIKNLILFGLVMGIIAFVGLAFLPNNVCYICMLLFFGCYGLCFVLVNSCSVPAALEFMPAEHLGVVSGKTMMLRWLGGAMGSAIMATIFDSLAKTHDYHYSLVISMLTLAVVLFVALAVGWRFIWSADR